MDSYKTNIEKLTNENSKFRKILYTNENTQLAIMDLKKREDIGMEKHIGITQFVKVESGSGTAIVSNKKYRLKKGDSIIIGPDIYHNIKAGSKGIKLYIIYSPPAH